VSSPQDPRQALARRLRALREQHWHGAGITQHQLAEALGGHRALSVSLISSWENPVKSAVPPATRLEAYATFFASRRSIEQQPYRLIPQSQLSDVERTAREQLLRELTELRLAAIPEQGARAMPAENSSGGLWQFPDLHTITIVCAQLPEDLRAGLSYSDPDSPDYVALYTYADLDALIELYGHLRAVNPASQVNFKTALELAPDDYTSHLVLLGGVDWNVVTLDLLERAELPVRQVTRHVESELGGFEVEQDGETRFFAPQLDENGQLIEDIAHFYRGPNPFNAKRTVTVCNGMYGRGTLGVVRALTDVRFRDRNDAYVRQRSAGARAYSIISRVSVVMGRALTPDWTQPDIRLHEYSEDAE
jgi:transcriptional regulator with XRE-family HTH domain